MILRQFLAAWAFLTGGSPANESLSSQSTVTRITETRSPTYYTTRFDYVNVDRFLSNSRLVNSYLACIMDKGPCTKEGNELKVIIPDAIKTDCSKCTERQRTGIEKVIEYLYEHKKDQWMELLHKIDPEGVDRAKYTLGRRPGYSPYA